MTAVASPPSFVRPAWSLDTIDAMIEEDIKFVPRKTLSRSNSSSSISSNASSNSSTTTVASSISPHNNNNNNSSSALSALSPLNNNQNKAANPTGDTNNQQTWSGPMRRRMPIPPIRHSSTFTKGDPWFREPGDSRQQILPLTGDTTSPLQMAHANQVSTHPQQQSNAIRPVPADPAIAPPALYLLSLNGTFERKTISIPYAPTTLKIGRQTNQKTVPTPLNGYFDSKVLSRAHAEIWAEKTGKIFIRDVKSSNGTFVNGHRLSPESRESEPHELQTGDHLELGIDIVNEDQKTIVHHKVAAKVEFAGFPGMAHSVLDMNFGDLDPANGGMMQASLQYPTRSRAGSNASSTANGRNISAQNLATPQLNSIPGLQQHQQQQHQQQQPPQQRGNFMLTQITTDLIVKRLKHEMRCAKLISEDLSRTSTIVHALTTKDDLRNLETHDPVPFPSMINGISFRADPKTRFSDPPAPPPQQPLPEKPDIPSLKRSSTEKPKMNASNSPVIDNNHQIVLLTDALNNVKKDFDLQATRMRELEDLLIKERAAREVAEDLAKRLEYTTPQLNGAPPESIDPDMILDDEFKPSPNLTKPDDGLTDQPLSSTSHESSESQLLSLQARFDAMTADLTQLKRQVDSWRERCEQAETDRDISARRILELVQKVKDDEAARQMTSSATFEPQTHQKQQRDRSRSRSRGRHDSRLQNEQTTFLTKGLTPLRSQRQQNQHTNHLTSSPDHETSPISLKDNKTSSPNATSLSRSDTIMPTTSRTKSKHSNRSSANDSSSNNTLVATSVPYASMLGVVLIGMGLMAYINGWQTQPKPLS